MLLLAIWFGMSVILTLATLFPARSNVSNSLITVTEILGVWTIYWIVLQGLLTVIFYQHIEANENGLSIQRGIIRRQIPWQQARLFALDHKNIRGVISTYYELSSSQQIIRWKWENSKRPLPQFTLNPSPPAYYQEAERLRSYIHEKTGLPLRDFPSF